METITIPKAEYEELLECRDSLCAIYESRLDEDNFGKLDDEDLDDDPEELPTP